MEKIKVGVLGSTGMVGQNYLCLLENHPWFEVSYVAASPQSAGKKYEQAVEKRWHMQNDIPSSIKELVVGDANSLERALNECSFVFSALEMDKEKIKKLESRYAKHIPVVSNASAHRWTNDVPMLIPEINPEHLDIIKEQQKKHKFKGFIVVKPNCTLQSYTIPVGALIKSGYEVNKLVVTTMQALSGAGYPGVSSLDIIDNIVPYISGEEEKNEQEPLKIFGKIEDRKIVPKRIDISCHCNRVPVVDGHTACVSLQFGNKMPELEEIIQIWNNFKSVPQELELPTAPKQPIVYRAEIDRPQPIKDRDIERGMVVSVGRLRECNIFDIRFVALSHNTIRGAAGGAILTAELLYAKGYLK
ncbi:aspartate-semialdehyde dehydrogenase [Candidatus Pacearchaeota archaeon]|nr:aspartate-semialdehyde dehydrogenase [Candidatus Pacearchaeota archaeon]